MGQNDQDKVVSDEELEKSFTDALADLSKAIDDSPGLQKAGGGEKDEMAKADVDVDVDSEEDEDEEDEGEEDEPESREDKKKKSSKKYSKKSEKSEKSLGDLEDELRKSEDDEVAGALDVSPLLQQLVKSIDGRDEHLEHRLDRLETIVKAQARVLEAQGELTKSTHDETRRIAQSPVSTNSVFSLQKSRFEEHDLEELDSTEVKQASSQWLAKGKIDINEAGRIESRANKGTLLKSGDNLDQKVEKLLKSMKKGDE